MAIWVMVYKNFCKSTKLGPIYPPGWLKNVNKKGRFCGF